MGVCNKDLAQSRKHGDVEKYKDYLKYTKKINFTDLGRCSQGYPLIQGYKNFMFYEILHHCNPNTNTMRTLVFDDFLVAGGLRLASERLPMVTSLDLCVIEKADWTHMFNFRCLKELFIFHCDIRDGHFADIGNIKTLDVLRIRRCSKLRGPFMNHISTIAPRLSTFEFEDWSKISRACYTNVLMNLQNVKLLVLYDATNLGDSSFIPLKGKFSKINELDIRGSKIRDKGLFSICTFSTLTNLQLLGMDDVTDQGLEFLHQLSLLEHLSFSGSKKVTDIGLLHISKIQNLKSLDIGELDLITDEGIGHLTNLGGLRSLDIGYNDNLTDRSLELISKKLLRLVYVSVTCELFTVNGLLHLLLSKNLRDTFELRTIEYHQHNGNISEVDFINFRSMAELSGIDVRSF